MNHTLLTVCLILLAVSASGSSYTAPIYAEWAHSHVVWINGTNQNEQAMYDLVNNYTKLGIKVGGINIDSKWSTCLNTYHIDRKKFPNMEKLIQDMHSRNIKVMLWTTSIINKECPEYEQGKKKNFFLNHGKLAHWWHGSGAFVDLFNPKARDWFMSLLDPLLEMGIDGWKCDGTDPLVLELRPWPYSPYLKRYLTHFQQYSKVYYRTFYEHTKSKTDTALIMARPVDNFSPYYRPSFAPKDVMFAGWVGDQFGTPQSFRDTTMNNIIHSASRGYLNFGFDIGGYKTSRDHKIQAWLLIRQAQIGAVLPFMENGGQGRHHPWDFDHQTIELYRDAVDLHYKLREFFLTAAAQAYKNKVSVLQPLVPDRRKINLETPQNLGYLLWKTFLVQPTFSETGFTDVWFPAKFHWVYYFNHSLIFEGGEKSALGIKLSEMALFIRTDSVFTFDGELWLVYLKDGKQKGTIVGGSYSDEYEVNLENGVLNITVDRYYPANRNRKHENERFMTVRLVGVEDKEQIRRNDGHKIESEATIYDNEVTIQVEFNKPNLIDLSFQKVELKVSSTAQKALRL